MKFLSKLFRKKHFTDLEIDIFERSVALREAQERAKEALGAAYAHHASRSQRIFPKVEGVIECEWGPPPQASAKVVRLPTRDFKDRIKRIEQLLKHAESLKW